MSNSEPERSAKLELNDSGIQDEDPLKAQEMENGHGCQVQLLDLSDDVLLYILKYCSPHDLKALGFTCARLGALVLERSLWTTVDARGVSTGRARMRWLLQALHAGTRNLLLTGHAEQARGCRGHVNRTRKEIEDGETPFSPPVPPLRDLRSGALTVEHNPADNPAREAPNAGEYDVIPPFQLIRQHQRLLANSHQLPRQSSSPSWPEDFEWDDHEIEVTQEDSSEDTGGCAGPVFTLSKEMMKELRARCPKLTSLNLEYCNINCSKINPGNFPSTLKRLSLRGTRCYNPPLDKSYLFRINDYLPELEFIDLSECAWLEPASLLPLSKLTRLAVLLMRECPAMAEFVAYVSLATRYGFRALKVLDVRGSPVGDSEVSALGWLPALQELHVAAPRPPAPPSPSPHHHYIGDPLPRRPQLADWEMQVPDYYTSREPSEAESPDGADDVQAQVREMREMRERLDMRMRGFESFRIDLDRGVNPEVPANTCLQLPVIDNAQERDNLPERDAQARVVAPDGNGLQEREPTLEANNVRANSLALNSLNLRVETELLPPNANFYASPRPQGLFTLAMRDSTSLKRGLSDMEAGPSKRPKQNNAPNAEHQANDCEMEDVSKRAEDDNENGEEPDEVVSEDIPKASPDDSPKSPKELSKDDKKPKIKDGDGAGPSGNTKKDDEDSGDSSDDSKPLLRMPVTKRFEYDINEGAGSSRDDNQGGAPNIDEPIRCPGNCPVHDDEPGPSNRMRDCSDWRDLPCFSAPGTSSRSYEYKIRVEEQARSTNPIDPVNSRYSIRVRVKNDNRTPARNEGAARNADNSGGRAEGPGEGPNQPEAPDGAERPPAEGPLADRDQRMPQQFVRFRRNQDPVVIECPNMRRQEQQVVQDAGEPRHHVLYVNLGQQLHAVYRLLPNHPYQSRTRSTQVDHLDSSSLVSDTSIRRFGRAEGEELNVVNIGPNGARLGGRDNSGRPSRSNLRILTVSGYRNVTNRSLIHLASAAPHLEFIDFSHTAVTQAGVEAFKTLRPEVQVLFSEFKGDENEE